MSENSADRKRSIIAAGMTLRGKIEGAEELTVAGQWMGRSICA